ncbi:hypothetical protein GQX74_003164 [Glossina fuscipes]|nr:hypothetical protein GQX74_003164 [Glossina fuscipes]
MRTLSANDQNNFINEQQCREDKTYDNWRSVDQQLQIIYNVAVAEPSSLKINFKWFHCGALECKGFSYESVDFARENGPDENDHRFILKTTATTTTPYAATIRRKDEKNAVKCNNTIIVNNADKCNIGRKVTSKPPSDIAMALVLVELSLYPSLHF